jgi:peptide deformylase
MAIRHIRKDGDEILRKKSKAVEVVTDKIVSLVKDMGETMHKAEGVGLAAPQVGILKRIVVIDVGDGLLELINPVVTSMNGVQTYIEG